jgi:hypothetical protein
MKLTALQIKWFVFDAWVSSNAMYHYPREELLADGKVAWRDFHWQWGHLDGELEETDLHPLPGFVIKKLANSGGTEGMMMMRTAKEDRDQEVGWAECLNGLTIEEEAWTWKVAETEATTGK